MFWSRAAQALAPCVGICNFDIVCDLSIVIWDFSAVFVKANRDYLNQLEADLTFPCSIGHVSFPPRETSKSTLTDSDRSDLLSRIRH